MDDGLGLIGKRFFIVLKRILKTGNNVVYSGIIKDIVPNKDVPSNYTIYLIDKFGKAVMLERYDIKEMREE